MLEPVGGAGAVDCGVTVIVLRGKPSTVLPVVPAAMLTVALLKTVIKVADPANTPVLLTMLPTETEPTPVTAVGVGGTIVGVMAGAGG